MPTKYSIILWRIKWKQIKTLMMLSPWVVPVQPTYLLCGSNIKSISRLFFNWVFRDYSLTVQTTEFLNNAVWKISNTPVPSPTHHTPSWTLHWNALGGLAWDIWSKRNRKLRQHTLRPLETPAYPLDKIFIRKASVRNWRRLLCRFGRPTSSGNTLSYWVTKCYCHIGECW